MTGEAAISNNRSGITAVDGLAPGTQAGFGPLNASGQPARAVSGVLPVLAATNDQWSLDDVSQQAGVTLYCSPASAPITHNREHRYANSVHRSGQKDKTPGNGTLL